MEMIFSDKTGQARERCQSVGKMLAVWRAEQIYKVVYGIVNPYKEGFTQSATPTSYSTYITSAGAGPWANKLTNFSLVDWTSIDTLEQLFAGMVDPFTGKRIQITPTAFLVPRKLLYTAKRIFNATETRSGATGSAPANQTLAPSPLNEDYPVMYDNIANAVLKGAGVTAGTVANATQADSLCVLADFKKAFGWRYVPSIGPGVKVTDLPISGEKMSQNIVQEVLAQVYGVAYVRDPRYAVQGYDNTL
jgi:muconolactone delta-isomerase